MAEIKRKLATIEKIMEIYPIEGADSIERAVLRGWNVVVRKDEFKVDDLVIYCEIDSVMPERPEFEFLRPRGFRIRTIKLRKQISQGIAFPLSILESVGVWIDDKKEIIEILAEDELVNIEVGTDMTYFLGITKYEAPIPAELSGKVKGGFPSHSIKTDEERIQNLIENYEDYRKEVWIATEKLDGSSASYFIYDNEFGVASRNLQLIESETNTFWKVARELEIEKKMRKYMADHNMMGLTLQSELYGEGIQKNKYRLKGQTVRFFRAFDPINYKFFSFTDPIFEELDLQTVPIIDNNFILPENYEDLIIYADGRSLLAEIAREGIVFVAKEHHEKYQGRLSFKVISNKFILKHDA